MNLLLVDSTSSNISINRNLIKDSQQGFARGESCLTNLVPFYKKVSETAVKNKNDILCIDLQKLLTSVLSKTH